MTSLDNQCCAYGTNNKRCTNLIGHGTDHCNLHRSKATNLYMKYKKLSDEVDRTNMNKKFDNNKNHIEYLMKYYILLNNTYDARSKHRNYAYVPSCSDEGHNFQFIRLTKLIEECELLLNTLYSKEDIHNENIVVKEKKLMLNSQEIIIPVDDKRKILSQRIKAYREFRKQKEAETDFWINKYIEENKLLLQKRGLLVENLYKLINELYDEHNVLSHYHGEHDLTEEQYIKIPLYYRYVMLFNIVCDLKRLNYFSKYYNPKRCNERGCSCKRILAQPVKLGCPCIKYSDTIKKYTFLQTEDSLKCFYDDLFSNRDKLENIICNVCRLYQKYEKKMIFRKMKLSWIDDIKVLTLLDLDEEYEDDSS